MNLGTGQLMVNNIMPKKTKIIFISTFFIVLLILLFLIFFRKSSNKNIININKNQPFIGIGNTNNGNNQNSNNNINNNANNNTNNKKNNNASNQYSRFFQITDFAIAGAGFLEENQIVKQIIDNTKKQTSTVNKTIVKPIIKFEKVPFVRYVKRQTGHIYQMNLKTKKVNKVSNSTIPDVYEVLFDSLSKNFIYRYISTENKTISSFVSSLSDKKGEFLPSNITNVSLSPNKNNFFYLVKNTSGVLGFTKSFTETKIKRVFSSSFSDWLSQWISRGKIYLTTKPSWRINGSLFSLNMENQILSKIFGGIKGLTTLANSNGLYVLYGNSLNIGPKLFILNTKDHSVKNLDLYGLPEKCIWANNNIYIYCAIPNTIIGSSYPDSWYQGLVSFTDYFVKINTQTLEKTTLANSKEETPIDAIHLFLNKTDTKLFFTNKKDSTLWSLDLS